MSWNRWEMRENWESMSGYEPGDGQTCPICHTPESEGCDCRSRQRKSRRNQGRRTSNLRQRRGSR